ncbi:hypothetical protein ACWGSK_10930 [Nocardiopsis sp. NPDC055551]
MAEIARNSIVVPVDDGMIRIADFKEVVDPSVPRRRISQVISERGDHLYIHCSEGADRVRVTARFFDAPGEGGDASMVDAGTARLTLRSQFLAVQGAPGSNFLWGAPFQGSGRVRVFHTGLSKVDDPGEEKYLLDFAPAR